MFGSKIARLVALFFIIEASFGEGVEADNTDIEPSLGNDGNGTLENFDDMKPVSELKYTDVIETITNKTYVLKLYSQKEDSDGKIDKDSPLIGKLLISEDTKVLKNGEQDGDIKTETRTIILKGDQIDKAVEEIPVEETETNKTEAVTTAPKEDSAPIEDSEADSDSEMESAEKTEDGTEKNETETHDATSAQPSAMVTQKETPSPEAPPEENAANDENPVDTKEDSVSSRQISSAVGIYGSLFKNILLLLPIFIGLSFI